MESGVEQELLTFHLLITELPWEARTIVALLRTRFE
jgi:hypothetical protein